MLIEELAYIKVLKFVEFDNVFFCNTDSSNAELSDPLSEFLCRKSELKIDNFSQDLEDLLFCR